MRYKDDDGRAKPDVSIIILNWNTNKLLEQCLTSIIQNTNGISYEIMIVDNNSAGTGFKKVKQKFSEYANFLWIENNKNVGGIADNQVLPYCRARYLLLMGPDTIILPQSLKRMVEFLDNNEEAGAVTAKLLNPDGSPQIYYVRLWNLSMVFFSTNVGRVIDKIFFKDRFKRYYFGGDIDTNKITMVEQPPSACFMFRRDPIATDCIIDEDFPFYFADVDLCRRIYDNHYKIFLLPSAEIIHFQGSSFKKADSDWKIKEYRSSLIKYFKKYHKSKVIFLRLILILDRVIKHIYKKLYPTWEEKV